MTEEPTPNPYKPPEPGALEAPAAVELGIPQSADLSRTDWILCIFCSGIACIIGIVRLIQGKPSAGKMILFAMLFNVAWRVVWAILEAVIS